MGEFIWTMNEELLQNPNVCQLKKLSEAELLCTRHESIIPNRRGTLRKHSKNKGMLYYFPYSKSTSGHAIVALCWLQLRLWTLTGNGDPFWFP